MALVETDPRNIKVDSLWKYAYADRPNINRNNTNPDFGVRAIDSSHTISFREYPNSGTSSTYNYASDRFLLKLIPIHDADLTKFRTQLDACIGFVAVNPDLTEELHEMLVQYEI